MGNESVSANSLSRGEYIRGLVDSAETTCITALRLAEESTGSDSISLIFLLGQCVEQLGECAEFYCGNLARNEEGGEE